MENTIRLRRATDRTYHLAKFRQPLPQLQTTSTTNDNNTAVRHNANNKLAPYRLHHRPNRTNYEGVVEAKASAATQNNNRATNAAAGSSYVLAAYDEASRTLDISPVDQWIAFKPAIHYATYTLEEAETALQRQEGGGSALDRKLSKMRTGRAAEDASAGLDDDEGAFEEDDDFEDDGLLEDGREGLDVEEGEMDAADDEDLGYEDDERAVSARAEGAKLEETRAAKLAAFGVSGDVGDEGDEPDALAASRWREQKRALRDAKMTLGSDDDDVVDDDDDDDDEAEASRAMLQQILGAADGGGGGEDGGGGDDDAMEVVVKEEEGRMAGRFTTSKRRLSGDAPAAAAAPDASAIHPDAKRRRGAEPAPPPMPVKWRVTERDVVMLIHQSDEMTTKKFNTHFHAFTSSEAGKDYLRKLVHKVASLSKNASGQYIMTLNDETLIEYKLGKWSKA